MASIHPYRKQIAIAMADGRERTTQDVCVAIGEDPKTAQHRIKNHLVWLKERGLLTCSPLYGGDRGASAWRKAV